MHRVISSGCLLVLVCGAAACFRAPRYDVVIRGGTIYDGSGGPPRGPTSGFAAIRSRRSAI